MCGRYSLICTDDLGNRFRVYEPTLGRRSRFNVAPSQTMPVVVQREQTELVTMQWGLVPHWARDLATARRVRSTPGPRRSTERPMFRGPAAAERRCLVPASGFYEWRRDGGGRKVPYYFRLRDADLFAFAGLYDVWHDTGRHGPHPTYTIVTTAANEVVAPLHDRMPVILRPEDEERWVAGGPPSPEERAETPRRVPRQRDGGIPGLAAGQQPGDGRPVPDRAARGGVRPMRDGAMDDPPAFRPVGLSMADLLRLADAFPLLDRLALLVTVRAGGDRETIVFGILDGLQEPPRRHRACRPAARR